VYETQQKHFFRTIEVQSDSAVYVSSLNSYHLSARDYCLGCIYHCSFKEISNCVGHDTVK